MEYKWHTLFVVAMYGKHQASFQVVRNNIRYEAIKEIWIKLGGMYKRVVWFLLHFYNSQRKYVISVYM